ncbi:hypothetical protein [Paenibacillus campinasensis]|uniref:Transmembrane Fragile-X-F protein n=1 Tax=Paenibacillus campinasensis TaxID=66347 RepID=A0A268EGZ4_9BACL|nr:hypothetical protein [Paenibacillus campinasensis]PAD72417.1 hypothetical protein CHH67_22515 [Paenibacillus campinasensis]
MDNQGGGIGILGLLGIVFVTLKLTGVIDWSWWWVTLPFWGGLALALVIALISLIAYGIASGVEANKRERRRRNR